MRVIVNNFGGKSKHYCEKKVNDTYIPASVWQSYFKALLNPDSVNNSPFDNEVKDMLYNHNHSECPNCQNPNLLSDPITKLEIKQAINELKMGKSGGINGILPEFFKHSSNIVEYLEILFNAVLDNGIFPDSWNVGMVVPLYKKGDNQDPNN